MAVQLLQYIAIAAACRLRHNTLSSADSYLLRAAQIGLWFVICAELQSLEAFLKLPFTDFVQHLIAERLYQAAHFIDVLLQRVWLSQQLLTLLCSCSMQFDSCSGCLLLHRDSGNTRYWYEIYLQATGGQLQ